MHTDANVNADAGVYDGVTVWAPMLVYVCACLYDYVCVSLGVCLYLCI